MAAVMQRFWADRDGHIAIEYGMIAALIVIGIIAALTGMGAALEGNMMKLLPALSGPKP